MLYLSKYSIHSHAVNQSTPCPKPYHCPTHRLIADSSGKVSYDESLRVQEVTVIVESGLAGDGESEVILVLTMDGLRETSVRGLGQLTLLVKKIDDARRTKL